MHGDRERAERREMPVERYRDQREEDEGTAQESERGAALSTYA